MVELVGAVVADVPVGAAASVAGASEGADVVVVEGAACVQESRSVEARSNNKTEREKVEIIPQLYERAIDHHVPRKENL
jgi:hypothetical protein